MTTRILCIDTSLDVCSVALIGGDDNEVLFLEEKGLNIHSARLTLMIENLVAKAGLQITQLDAICIDKGPGSYTGLRIGTSTAKGLCYALNKPLISINTLETMARFASASINPSEELLLCPMIDARRMEVYYGLYDLEINPISETKAEVVTEGFLTDALENPVLFFGNGMAKCRLILESHPNARFLEGDIYPRADYMAAKAVEKYQNQAFEDLFSFEPFYLKDFMTAQMIQNQSQNTNL